MITLANLSEATEQEVFDQVARHLLTQNSKSVGSEITSMGIPLCKYRGKFNKKCAAGCLIADDEYLPIMDKSDGVVVKSTSWAGLIQSGLVPTEKHRLLILKLQSLHDHKDPSIWRESLSIVALQKDLNTKVLEEFN